jgi:hypothetical protein
MKPCIRLLMALAILAGLRRATAQVSFSPAVNYTVGSGPTSVTAADVNGDGKLDLICANYGLGNDNTLTVLTNNGNGVFGSNATLTVGNGVGFVMAADINGDGKVDLISANANDSTLTILTNNGSGVFGSNATLTVGMNPAFVVAADVRGSGKLDLISANFGSYGGSGNTLTVLTNNGAGVFGSNATLIVGNNPNCVAAADINGDGKVDLISANFYDGTLTVLTNNGAGVFGSNATLFVGGNPRRVVAADVNGDGKLDLISANYNVPGTLTVLTNNGSGVFGLNATLNVGNEPADVVAADVNGNGTLDLISANDINNFTTLTVLTNNGSGVFSSNAMLTVGNRPLRVVAADVNGDGKLDLITANFDDNTLSVMINCSTFPPPTSTPTLNIKYSGNGMLVSWPSASAGWSLQQNPDLTTPSWGPSGYSGYGICDDGTNKSLIIPSQPGNLFFRLLHP